MECVTDTRAFATKMIAMQTRQAAVSKVMDW
jgi:hypothetical protein